MKLFYKNFLFVLISILALLFSCRNPKLKVALTPNQVIENNALALLKDTRFHSVSIAVYKNGKSISSHFGELTIGKSNTPTDTTIYEIASVSKTFLGILAAQAVLDGTIGLEDDIRKYLKEPYPNLEYKGESIKIKHLLTHTSGFPNFPIKGDTKSNFFEGLKEIRIKSFPGTDYNYSNTAPELMAYILEQVYNVPYEDLVLNHILQPNQMNNTKFDLNKEERLRLVKGYNEKSERMPNFKRNLWGGTIGLHSTTTDMLKYIELQLDSTNRAVEEAHRKLADTPYDFSIGYYWNLVDRPNTKIYRHHGGIYGMQNWLVIYPEDNIGISILTNSSFDETGEILEKVVEDLYLGIKDVSFALSD